MARPVTAGAHPLPTPPADHWRRRRRRQEGVNAFHWAVYGRSVPTCRWALEAGVDTRALTLAISERGMPHAVIAHNPEGKFDLDALLAGQPKMMH